MSSLPLGATVYQNQSRSLLFTRFLFSTAGHTPNLGASLFLIPCFQFHYFQSPDGKQVRVEDGEERLTAIHNPNNSKSWGIDSGAGHWLLPSSSASSSSSSPPPPHQAGRWVEVGEEASLKKRRGSCTEGVDEEERLTTIKEKKRNMQKRRTSTKNFDGDEDNGEKKEEEEEEEEEEKYGTDDTDFMKKKGNGNSSNSSGGGGSTVMEGSRCSRVNGRGWRCCQQTLVGYALCEHHLGKGRLRSMISVRSRSSSTEVAAPPQPPGDDEGSLSSLSCQQQREDGDEEGLEEKLMMMKQKNKNKRKRIGIVKARSISSLLGQTHHVAAPTTAPATAIALVRNLSSSSNDNLA